MGPVVFGLAWRGKGLASWRNICGARIFRPGMAGPGSERLGRALLGSVRYGRARFGVALCTSRKNGVQGFDQLGKCGPFRQCKARLGAVRQGSFLSSGGSSVDMSFLNTLRKGDTIEGHDVLKTLGVLPEDIEPGGIPPEIRLAGKIERELHRVGKFWTVRASAGCVTVLTDHDAYHHNRRRHRSGIRKFRRAMDGMKGVDTRKFTAQDRDEFDLVSRKIAAQYLAISQAKPNPSAMVKPVKAGR